MPFDWCITNNYIINDCIKNNFQSFLNTDYFIKDKTSKISSGNIKYHKNLYHHKNVFDINNLNYYHRCVDRFINNINDSTKDNVYIISSICLRPWDSIKPTKIECKYIGRCNCSDFCCYSNETSIQSNYNIQDMKLNLNTKALVKEIYCNIKKINTNHKFYILYINNIIGNEESEFIVDETYNIIYINFYTSDYNTGRTFLNKNDNNRYNELLKNILVKNVNN